MGRRETDEKVRADDIVMGWCVFVCGGSFCNQSKLFSFYLSISKRSLSKYLSALTLQLLIHIFKHAFTIIFTCACVIVSSVFLNLSLHSFLL